MQGEQLRLPLVGGRITYEQSLLLPLETREDGRRVLTERQIRENPELWKLVHGPYRGSFKPLWHTMEYQFREPDGRGRVRAYEAPPEEGMCWIEGSPVGDPE